MSRGDTAVLLEGIPLFWPVAAAGLAAALGLAGVLARALRAPRAVAFLLVASLGLVAAATLTPAAWPEPHLGCVVGELGPPPLFRLSDLNETSLNVALFLPLGVACGLLPGLGRAAIASVAAAAVPLAVELTQAELPWLGRVCTTDDVMANLTGLAAGITAALLVRPWLP